MDSKTREKILHRCEILKYMGDDGIPCIYDELPDDQLMEDCGWVLDKAHDDLDEYQFGVTRKIIDREARFQQDLERIRALQSQRQSKDMWS